jgi:hypothetical protein
VDLGTAVTLVRLPATPVRVAVTDLGRRQRGALIATGEVNGDYEREREHGEPDPSSSLEKNAER